MVAELRHDAVILLILIQHCCLLLLCDSLVAFGGRLPIGEALAFSDSLGSEVKCNGGRRPILAKQIDDTIFSGPIRMPITTATISYRIVAKMPLAHHIGGGGVAAATVGGGLLSGMLHAVSGPDHLATLLPRVIGKMGIISMWIGALWGLGHGISASIIVLAAYFFKDRLQGGLMQALFLELLNSWTGGLIGLSLIAIGAVGLCESRAKDAPSHSGEGVQVDSGKGITGSCCLTSLPPESSTVGGAASGRTTSALRAIFLNGLLHGLNLDGAPSLMPALACISWKGVCSFLLAYCSGTILAMSTAAAIIGEGSTRVSRAFGSPDFAHKLSMVSSILAIVIGLIFIFQNITAPRIRLL